jgi:hypothetical protein
MTEEIAFAEAIKDLVAIEELDGAAANDDHAFAWSHALIEARRKVHALSGTRQCHA